METDCKCTAPGYTYVHTIIYIHIYRIATLIAKIYYNSKNMRALINVYIIYINIYTHCSLRFGRQGWMQNL